MSRSAERRKQRAFYYRLQLALIAATCFILLAVAFLVLASNYSAAILIGFYGMVLVTSCGTVILFYSNKFKKQERKYGMNCVYSQEEADGNSKGVFVKRFSEFEEEQPLFAKVLVSVAKKIKSLRKRQTPPKGS